MSRNSHPEPARSAQWRSEPAGDMCSVCAVEIGARWRSVQWRSEPAGDLCSGDRSPLEICAVEIGARWRSVQCLLCGDRSPLEICAVEIGALWRSVQCLRCGDRSPLEICAVEIGARWRSAQWRSEPAGDLCSGGQPGDASGTHLSTLQEAECRVGVAEEMRHSQPPSPLHGLSGRRRQSQSSKL